MTAAPPLAELDAMLDATLGALARRADSKANDGANEGADEGMVSFGVEGASPEPDPQIDELWQMIESARTGATDPDDDAMVSFGAGGSDEGMLARIGRESSELVDGLLWSLANPHVIETGEGPTRVRTSVGWLGDTSTHIGRGVTPEVIAAHVAATEASLTTSAHRLRMLAMVVTAAGRISAVIATPGGGLMALPIAYKCVREVYQRWIASSTDPNPRGTPW